jgi:hypothetical protein
LPTKFAKHFYEINNDFLKRIKVKYPGLTKTDLKVCAYLQLKLSSKEIAQLMNISVRGAAIASARNCNCLPKKRSMTS